MWALHSLSWIATPEPARGTRRNGDPGGPYSTDAVDLRLHHEVTIPGKGHLIDPEIDDVRDDLEKSWRKIDLREQRRWIWSVLKRPLWWFWFIRNPKLWRMFCEPRKGYLLFPGDLLLGNTLEVIELPTHPEPEQDGTPTPRLSGLVDGKTAIGRLFVIVHSTAQTIHNGTVHQIRLEIANFGWQVVILTERMRICQLHLDLVEGETVEDGCRHDVVKPLGREGQ
jgi:deoxycytidine triphosphate deaminase